MTTAKYMRSFKSPKLGYSNQKAPAPLKTPGPFGKRLPHWEPTWGRRFAFACQPQLSAPRLYHLWWASRPMPTASRSRFGSASEPEPQILPIV
jgi:hypothetical protein